jgi:hypothetical protein
MDHKWQVIAARAGVKVGIVSAVAWALLDYASQHKDRGTVSGFDVEVYAVYSGFAEEEINAVITAMQDKGVIVSGKLAKWDERQPKREDYSTPRVEKMRALKRDVTQCNTEKEDVTFSLLSSSSLSESLSESVVVEEEEQPDDFELLRLAIQDHAHITPSTQADVKAITEMLEANVTPADIPGAVQWLIDNEKTVRYTSTLVGPAKTQALKRLQPQKSNGNGNGKAKIIRYGPDGEAKEFDY